MTVSLEQAMTTAFKYAESLGDRKLGRDYYHDSYDFFKANLEGTPTEYGDWIELVHIFTINRNQLALADCYMNYQKIEKC